MSAQPFLFPSDLAIRLLTGVLTLLLLIARPGPPVIQAGPLDEVGYTDLLNLLGASTPTGAGVPVSQIEVGSPNSADSEFNSKVITRIPGGTSTASHATQVGWNFYGNTLSMAPGIDVIQSWNANHWMTSGFLRISTFGEPVTETQAIENHSWVIEDGSDSAAIEILQRLDYVVNRDNVLVVAAQNNGETSPIPETLSQLYNGLTVGVTSGTHSHGQTYLDGSGRSKPEIVAPQLFTSYATPMVSAAGALLIEHATNTAGISSATNTEVIKAILMAGATKEEFSSWSRSTSQPFDTQFGSGELNVFRSYHILDAGQQSASNSSLVDPQGWDFATTSSNSFYFFEIPEDQAASEFSAILTWNRNIENGSLFPGGFTPEFNGLENLDLKLYHAGGLIPGSMIDSSESSVDNAEHIYLNDSLDMGSLLEPGQYALEVVAPSTGVDYGLAWLADFQEVHQWAASTASAAWETNLNWSVAGVPAEDWFATLDNTTFVDGQKAVINTDSTVYKVRVSGSVGRMTLDLPTGTTLSSTSDVEIRAGGAITGGGVLAGNLQNESLHAVSAVETLTVTDQAQIAGTWIVVDDSYSQVRGTTTGSFDLLTAGNITGSFSNLAGAGISSHLGNGYFLETLTPSLTAMAFAVDILAALEGDANGDKKVEISDYMILVDHFDPGTPDPSHVWTQGNFNDDLVIDLSDYNLLAQNFDPTGYAAAFGDTAHEISFVPEPGSASFTLIAILFFSLGSTGTRCRH
ncbi:MAG: hypothetical protein CMJ62_07565 [Planctomycetaceae bacterium]|nr:hypothetical protein [Planctomycetaceae bacterium]